MHTRTTSTTLVVTAILALAACTTGGATEKADATASPSASQPLENQDKANNALALEKAVRSYVTALYQPDVATARGLLSQRCGAKADKSLFSNIVEGYAADFGHLSVKTFAIDQISSGEARVSYTVGLPNLDTTNEHWTRESGKWLYDRCTT